MKRSAQSLLKLSLGLSLGTLFSHNALADADIAYWDGTGTRPASLTATAHVDLCVTVPEILIFGVGETGDDIAEICWNCDPAAGLGTLPTSGTSNNSYSGDIPTFTAPAPFSTATVGAIYDDDADSDNANSVAHSVGSFTGNTATLPVYLFSNHGTDVTITSTYVSGEDGGGSSTTGLENLTSPGYEILLSEFTFADNGNIDNPGAAGSVTVTHTNGIVNEDNDWTYAWTPGAIPVAGKYEGRITYVAAQP